MFPRSRPSPPLRCKLSSTSTFPDACGRVVSAAMFHLADQPYLNPYAVRCSYCHADRCRRDKTWNSSIPIAFAPCRALTAPRATWTPTLPIRFAAGQTDAPEPVQRLEEPLLGTYNTVTGQEAGCSKSANSQWPTFRPKTELLDIDTQEILSAGYRSRSQIVCNADPLESPDHVVHAAEGMQGR